MMRYRSQYLPRLSVEEVVSDLMYGICNNMEINSFEKEEISLSTSIETDSEPITPNFGKIKDREEERHNYEGFEVLDEESENEIEFINNCENHIKEDILSFMNEVNTQEEDVYVQRRLNSNDDLFDEIEVENIILQRGENKFEFKVY